MADLYQAKRKEYNDYIVEHIQNVQKAFIKVKTYKDKIIQTYLLENPELMQELITRVTVHDKSKFSEEEFEPYRKNFFPINDEEKENNKEDFEKAWEHHWKNNDHHWQARENTKTLNRGACWEMVLDWMAMDMKFNNKCWEYYEQHKDEIHMNDLETEYVEDILAAIKDEDMNGNV